MYGLDTNVLIRYLTQDDPEQSEKANAVISKAAKHGETFWVSQITLCETVWVLLRAYKISKEELISILHMLLQTQELVFEKHDVIYRAIHDYRKCRSAGFVDCVIGRQNESNDCEFTYTFDQGAARELTTFKSQAHNES